MRSRESKYLYSSTVAFHRWLVKFFHAIGLSVGAFTLVSLYPLIVLSQERTNLAFALFGLWAALLMALDAYVCKRIWIRAISFQIKDGETAMLFREGQHLATIRSIFRQAETLHRPDRGKTCEERLESIRSSLIETALDSFAKTGRGFNDVNEDISPDALRGLVERLLQNGTFFMRFPERPANEIVRFVYGPEKKDPAAV